MKQKSKTLIFTAAAILAVSTASADVALTVPESSKDIEGLKTSYRIGLINTGGAQRNISFTADSPQALNISIPETVSLSPSSLSSSPEGENWYQAAPGRYVKIDYVKLNVSVDPRLAQKRRFDFSVLASTTRESSISRPEVSSVNQLDFTLYSRSSEIDTGFKGSLWEDSEEGEGGDRPGQNSSEGSSEVESPEPDNSTHRPDNSTSNLDTGRDGSGPESVTIILLLGIVLTAGYVLSEVMI